MRSIAIAAFSVNKFCRASSEIHTVHKAIKDREQGSNPLAGPNLVRLFVFQNNVDKESVYVRIFLYYQLFLREIL